MNLDKADMKVLSSDTRVEILRALTDRRKMPSELARELGIKPSTVVEHLKILKKSGMVTKIHTGHKWKYYDLSKKGANLIRPKFPVQFAIILTIGLIMIIGGFYDINTIVDFEYDYPIMKITKTITETVVEETVMRSSEGVAASGLISDELANQDTPTLDTSNPITETIITNQTTYASGSVPIEKVNWTSIAIIVFGSVIVILSMKKIVKEWLL
jgi:DNA-binding transcriptional ArsR family regulator